MWQDLCLWGPVWMMFPSFLYSLMIFNLLRYFSLFFSILLYLLSIIFYSLYILVPQYFLILYFGFNFFLYFIYLLPFIFYSVNLQLHPHLYQIEKVRTDVWWVHALINYLCWLLHYRCQYKFLNILNLLSQLAWKTT